MKSFMYAMHISVNWSGIYNKKELLNYRWTCVMKSCTWIRGEEAFCTGLPPSTERTTDDPFSCFCSVFWNGKKKCVLYTQDIWRQMENIKEVYLTVRKKTRSALDRFCLNKFTHSWETQVPRKTTFVTFSVLGIVYQTSWQWKPSQRKGDRGRNVALYCVFMLFNDIFVRSVSCDWPEWYLGRIRIRFHLACQGKTRVTACLQMCG